MGRIRPLACAAGVALAGLAASPSGAFASFGPEAFEAGTCANHTCTYSSVEANREEAFTQAAGHPPWGITKFVMKHSGTSVEGASVKRIRVDVPPGLASNPDALPKCSLAQFESNPRGCPASTEVGTTEMEAIAEPLGLPLALPALAGTVYNLEPPPGLPLDFGIAVEPAGELVTPIRLFLEGHLSWQPEPALQARGVPSGDYHEWFEIDNVPNSAEVKALPGIASPLKVVMSKLNFDGRAGQGNFITIPSVCSSTTTTYLELESWSGERSSNVTHTPVGVDGCNKVPFNPSATAGQETAQSDQPDGASVSLDVAQKVAPTDINTADVKDVALTFPEGLTLNPSAAGGLTACSTPPACASSSSIGSVAIYSDLPEPLTGNVYLLDPSGGPITGPPFAIYINADGLLSRYGVAVRLEGLVSADPNTGRLVATFTENPPLPFEKLELRAKGGALAPLANPLSCVPAGEAQTSFTPYTGLAAWTSTTSFPTTGCPSPIPFSLTQGATSSSDGAGAYTSYTFKLARADGQQYLSQVSATLPPGLVGEIPHVPLCGEPQAQQGTCAPASQIGTASVNVGAGSQPYSFSGPVYLTGPYDGAPYGLSIPVAAVAGPFDFGTLVTRAAINVDPRTARVIATSAIPTIFKGVPLRLRSVSVDVNHGDFLFNPTNCGPLSADSTLSSTFGATQDVSSPFQVGGCSSLAFKPSFTVSSSANANKAIGAGLHVGLSQGPHQANLQSVTVQLPAQLPSRLTTLQKACPEATYAANPFSCPAGSKVGSATVSTPVLASKLTGPAYLVSHAAAAFPDLDLLLEGGGVRVILVGNTNITKGVTTSTFASIPDVPVSSFALDLPTGPNSALAVNGSLCSAALIMPTTLIAQSGARIKQNTEISVAGCPFGSYRHKLRIAHRKVAGHTLILKIQTLLAGRVTVAGKDLHTVGRRIRRPSTFILRVPLSRAGMSTLRRHHRLTLKIRATLSPTRKSEGLSVTSSTYGFRGK